ncbi:MAG: hypothetical protein RMJ43_01385 [Chloroherpetonaceae bacterium]|nr:hypothetical protein [Chthonomonadaceae bacterium]MDW8206461.1 hypothetical protein [Chloroherpetonaceae bacterium]
MRNSVPSTPRRMFALLLLAFGALTGCSSAVVTTEVREDGTWKRTLRLRAPSAQRDGDSTGGILLSGETLDSAFVLVRGSEWKTTRSVEKEAPGVQNAPGNGPMEVFTAERILRPGEAIDHDVAVRNPEVQKADPVVVNTAQVRQIAPGRYEYREVLRWKGPGRDATQMEKLTAGEVQRAVQELKALLPPALATEKTVKRLGANLMREVWQLMFGPHDPLVADLWKLAMFPDMTMPDLLRGFYRVFDRALAQTFGSTLPAAQRRAIARKFAQDQTAKVQRGVPPGPSERSSGGVAFVAMTYRVRMPGRVIATNGQIDPITENEVYWTFFSPAPMAGDVELRAVSQVPARR